MGKRLYVGNLSSEMTDTDLYNCFAPHGTIRSAQVVVDEETGQSKGFGVVDMDSGDQAQAAIKALNHAPKRGPRVLASVPRSLVPSEHAASCRGGRELAFA